MSPRIPIPSSTATVLAALRSQLPQSRSWVSSGSGNRSLNLRPWNENVFKEAGGAYGCRAGRFDCDGTGAAGGRRGGYGRRGLVLPGARRWGVRLHEKGGKLHAMPAHHNLEEYWRPAEFVPCCW